MDWNFTHVFGVIMLGHWPSAIPLALDYVPSWLKFYVQLHISESTNGIQMKPHKSMAERNTGLTWIFSKNDFLSFFSLIVRNTFINKI